MKTEQQIIASINSLLLAHVQTQSPDFLAGFVSSISYLYPESRIAQLHKDFFEYPLDGDAIKSLSVFINKNHGTLAPFSSAVSVGITGEGN